MTIGQRYRLSLRKGDVWYIAAGEYVELLPAGKVPKSRFPIPPNAGVVSKVDRYVIKKASGKIAIWPANLRPLIKEI